MKFAFFTLGCKVNLFETQALSQLTAQQNAAPEAAETPQEAPEEPVRSEIRDIYEVFLDSVCLDEILLVYLILAALYANWILPLGVLLVILAIDLVVEGIRALGRNKKAAQSAQQ